MYVQPNFKTKKALKEAVKAYNEHAVNGSNGPGSAAVHVFSPGPFPAKANGSETVEGPHYPAAHTWYAQVVVVDGIVVKVKS